MVEAAILKESCLLHPGKPSDQNRGGWVVWQKAWRVLVLGKWRRRVKQLFKTKSGRATEEAKIHPALLRLLLLLLLLLWWLLWYFNVNKNPTDATVCRYLFTAKLLYMFRVSQHPSSGVLKTVPAASGTGHTTCTATPFQRGLIGTQSRSDHGKYTK